jgi:hypothetical protein
MAKVAKLKRVPHNEGPFFVSGECYGNTTEKATKCDGKKREGSGKVTFRHLQGRFSAKHATKTGGKAHLVA